MTLPTLSVAMGNFNKADYIAGALTSVLQQSVPPMEIVLVDDGSSDNSPAIIEDFARRHPGIKLLRNPKNMGPMYTYNRAVEHCSGDCVYMMGCDDTIRPGFFEKSLTLLENYPEAGLCTSDPAFFYEGDGVCQIDRRLWSDRPAFFPPGALADVFQGTYIASHATIARREDLMASGLHLERFKWHSDWFFWLVIAFRKGVAYIPEPLADMRVCKASYSDGAKDRKNQHDILKNILNAVKTPEFEDLLPYFCRASVMSHFGDEIVRVVMSDPGLWDDRTRMLISHPLWAWSQRVQARQEKRNHAMRMEMVENDVLTALRTSNAAIAGGDAEQAYHIIESLAKRHPDHIYAQLALAQIAAVLGKAEIVHYAVDKVNRLEPDNAEVQIRLGEIHIQMGERKMAESAFKNALILDSTNQRATANLQSLYAQAGHQPS